MAWTAVRVQPVGGVGAVMVAVTVPTPPAAVTVVGGGPPFAPGLACMSWASTSLRIKPTFAPMKEFRPVFTWPTANRFQGAMLMLPMFFQTPESHAKSDRVTVCSDDCGFAGVTCWRMYGRPFHFDAVTVFPIVPDAPNDKNGPVIFATSNLQFRWELSDRKLESVISV